MTANEKTSFIRRRPVRAALWVGLPLFAACAFIAPKAFAGPGFPGFGGPHGPHHGPPESPEAMSEHMNHRLDRVLDRLDASDAQRDKVASIVSASAPEMFALAEQAHQLRDELKAALTADQVDTAQVATLSAEIETTAGQAARLGVETLAKLAGVLDAQQRAQVAEHLERRFH